MSSPKPSFFTKFRKNESSMRRLSSAQIEEESKNVSADNRRDYQIEQLLHQPVIDLEQIRNLSWAGLPYAHRARIWRLFLDYEPVNSSLAETTLKHKRNDYFDCLDRVYNESQRHMWTNAQNQTYQQILRDLPRSHIPLLRTQRVMHIFEEVLFVWSVRHPASGYVQGMNDMLHPFFFAFLSQYYKDKTPAELEKLQNIDDLPDDALKEVEADSFWCFSKLLDGLQDLYTKDQPGLYKMLDHLKEVVEKADPVLAKHIDDEGLQYQEFAFRWMNCLLVREFTVPTIFRMWDNYLAYPSQISNNLVYLCAAMMSCISYKLLPLNHAEFVILMQGITPHGWHDEEIEEILAQAYVYEKNYSPQNHRHGVRSASAPILTK